MRTTAMIALGNRLRSTVAENYQYNLNNQLSGFGQIAFDYDNHGNMVRKNVGGVITTFNFTVDNRLERIEDGAGNEIGAYSYDPFGRRLWKVVNGIRTCFDYNDQGLIGEYDAAGNQLKSYGYQPGSSWSTNSLYMKVGDSSYWYQNDHLGTPQKFIAANGALVWEAKYDSFGRVDVLVEAVTNNLRFPGQYYDAETGLHYNWNRYYDPATGRYITADPIGLEGGDNLYLYANANSINLTDPMGLWVNLCARKLGDPDGNVMDPSGNPVRHDFLVISGKVRSFQRCSNIFLNQGWVDRRSEGPGSERRMNYKCKRICSDDKFDKYVLEAANNAPNYNITAYKWNPIYWFGFRNCQSWASEVIEKAKEKYLKNEDCPKCFK